MIKYTLYRTGKITQSNDQPTSEDRCDLCRELLADSQYCRASMDGWHIWLVRRDSETITGEVSMIQPHDQAVK